MNKYGYDIRFRIGFGPYFFSTRLLQTHPHTHTEELDKPGCDAHNVWSAYFQLLMRYNKHIACVLGKSEVDIENESRSVKGFKILVRALYDSLPDKKLVPWSRFGTT